MACIAMYLRKVVFPVPFLPSDHYQPTIKSSINFQLFFHLLYAAEWWIHYGTCAPELQRIAIRVLSQTTSSSNCERNWSTFSLIHTKTRNRLKYKKLQKLVFLHYNMRLKLRHISRRSQTDIDASFNPINLDYIFEEDDPMGPWLEEREAPLLDGRDDNDWLELSSDDEQDPTVEEQQQPSASNPTGSGSESGGLSPPSEGDGDGGDGGGEEIGIASGTGDASGSPFRGNLGDQSIYGFQPDEEIGNPVPPPTLTYVSRKGQRKEHEGGNRSRRNRERNRESSVESSSHGNDGIIQSFGDFGIGDLSSTGSYQPSFPYQPNYPPYPGPPPPGPPPYAPEYYLPPYGAAVHYQEQQQQEVDYGLFHYIIPQGWGENEGSQGTSQSQSTTQEEQPRHSFWW